jgi:hypothetical protein
MTTSRSRRIQSRRALAILAWAMLAVVAWLLWHGQRERLIRIQAWEPAALLLSAYATFLAIFGWLLFSPGLKSAEESPGLFFAGLLTLIPPCYIAYNLIPVDSPLRPWLTLGVFVFGLFAIVSPLPPEVFAVPRDRKSYLQPLTDAYLSVLDVEEPAVHFENVIPETRYWLTRPAPEESQARDTVTRDPWVDPFSGTGRRMSRVGAAPSTRSAEKAQANEQRKVTPGPAFPVHVPQPPPVPFPQSPAEVSSSTARPAGEESIPLRHDHAAAFRNANNASGAAAELENRNEHIVSTASSLPFGPATPATRRPLTEPTQKSIPAVGFHLPLPALRPETPVPPPLPAAQKNGPSLRVATHPLTAVSEQKSIPAATLPLMPPPLPVTSADIGFGPSPTSAPPSNRSASSPVAQHDPTSETSFASLQELDRHFREQAEADDRDEKKPVQDRSAPSTSTTDRSVSASTGNVSMERFRDEHGGEMIEGTIKVFFEIGQKRAHLHVPFSPPLPGLPEVECEPTGEEPIRLKIAVRQPYGIRIEARRTESADPLNTEISFAAVYTPGPRRKS